MMSLIDWYFNLYDSNKDGILDAKDIVDMSKETFWLLSYLKDDDIAWDATVNLIIRSCEQSEAAKGNAPDVTALTQRFADLTMISDAKTFKGRLKQLNIDHTIEITLPSFRMVVLTNETLEMFFDHGFLDSFRVVQSATDKSLGRELFDSLFANGQTLLATTTQHLSPAVSRPRSSSSASSDVQRENEVDTLLDEWDHFDI